MLGVVSPMMMEKTSAFGSCDRGLPSILVCDAAMLAATLCRVLRGLPLMEAGLLVCFQDVSAATLAAAGASLCRALFVFGFCGSGMGMLLNCSVSPWVGIFLSPDGFWNEADLIVFSVMFLSEGCSSRFQGERVKLTEDSSLLFAGYVGPSQVMYGIQEAAAACPFVACAGPLELFVGWQAQSAARTMIGMLALVFLFSVIGLATTTLSKGLSYAAAAAATPRVDVENDPKAAAALDCVKSSLRFPLAACFKSIPTSFFPKLRKGGKKGRSEKMEGTLYCWCVGSW